METLRRTGREIGWHINRIGRGISTALDPVAETVALEGRAILIYNIALFAAVIGAIHYLEN